MSTRPSGLILPGIRPAERNAAHRGRDYATLEQVNNMLGNMIGPIAITLEEVMMKVARCEDKLGITNETVAAEEVDGASAPVGSAPRVMLLLRTILDRQTAIEGRLGMTQQVEPETPPEVMGAVVPNGGDID